MEKTSINLYDSENDYLIEVDVSKEDAERATKDSGFAAMLFKQAIDKATFDNTNSDNNNTADNVDLTVSDFVDSEMQESEVSLYRWSPPCVLFLLETFKSLEKQFSNGKLSQKKVWERVSEELCLNGYNVTGPQCSAKLRSLKKSYKSVKDHNNKSGNDRRTWQYYEIMDEIFSKKASCEPVAVASSSGLSTTRTEGSDSGCTMKSNKTQISSLLEKRLQQKEDHEKNKMQRHKERMEMDEKFLTVLEKISNK